MKKLKKGKGFTLIEMTVSVAVFVLFSFAVYEAFRVLLKVVYSSRIKIIETALLDEQLEIARNLTYGDIGIVNGIPPGLLYHTTTTYRNGIPFTLTTAVRSIDDPFDGTINSSPKDLAPADYKLVEMTATCQSCEHQIETTVSTVIGPKDLEGQSTNGAIFINVTDSHNNPIPGANVYVINSSTVPNIIVEDITDKDGYLRIVDTPTGTLAYAISVTKPGYSTDHTFASSTDNPNPINRLVTVVSQDISNAFFSIDLFSSLTAHTINESCETVGDASLRMYGNRLIGQPDVRRYSQNLQTDSSGNLDVQNLEFDKYNFDLSATGYDLAGSIPIAPLDLPAGGHKEISLILAPHTSNSLLVSVLDNANDQPVSNASIKLTRGGFQQTQKTNFSSVTQDDWSGAANAENYSELLPSDYWTSNFVDTLSSPGNILLGTFGTDFWPDGYLESSIFDLGKKVDFKEVTFTSDSQPPETGERSILIQLAMSNTSTIADLSNFKGPDGTIDTFYSPTSTNINTGGKSYRFFRYKVFLSTKDVKFTPAFSSIAVTFTNGCTPPGQVFYPGLSAGAYSMQVSAPGYNTTTVPIDVSGRSTSTVSLHQTI